MVDTPHNTEDTMTELIPGKRYRLIVETTYDAIRSGFVLNDGTLVTRFNDVTTGRVKAELLPDPLPTTPGSVVRDESGDLFILSDEEQWCSPGQSGEYLPEEFEQPVVVLFDAGAERA